MHVYFLIFTILFLLIFFPLIKTSRKVIFPNNIIL